MIYHLHRLLMLSRTFSERRKDITKISWTGSNYTWTSPNDTFLILWNNLTRTIRASIPSEGLLSTIF